EIISIHIAAHGAEFFDCCRARRSRNKTQCFGNVTTNGSEEPLGTEHAKEIGKLMVNIPKPNGSICWIVTVGAYLKPCSQSEEEGPARRVVVEEIRRHRVRCGDSVWNRVLVKRGPAAG